MNENKIKIKGLPKGSLLHTELGLIKIERIFFTDKVLTSKGYSKVKTKSKPGKQKIITIKTEDGELNCTKDYKIAVYNKNSTYSWKKAEDLTENDILITSRQAIIGSNNLYVNTSLNNLVESNITKESLDFIKGIYPWIIGFNQKSNVNIYKILELINGFNGNEYFYKFITNDNLKVDYYDRNIPDFIYESDSFIKLAYLAGIIDGTFYTNTIIDNNTIVSDKSLEWIKQLQILCYSCGFETTIEEKEEEINLKISTKYAKNIIESIPQITNTLNFDKLFLKDTNDLLKYNLVKVIGIEDNNEEVETYDIELENKDGFYCNGYFIL